MLHACKGACCLLLAGLLHVACCYSSSTPASVQSPVELQLQTTVVSTRARAQREVIIYTLFLYGVRVYVHTHTVHVTRTDEQSNSRTQQSKQSIILTVQGEAKGREEGRSPSHHVRCHGVAVTLSYFSTVTYTAS